MVQCRIQLEEALNKLRWNKLIDRDDTEREVNLYNSTTKAIDINTLKVTSLPFNPGVRMPWALEEKEEVRMSKFRSEVMNAAKHLKGKSREWNNLKEGEKEGLKILKERMRNDELICSITDKSGRWSCDTVENYKEACMEELRDEEKTPEMTAGEHEAGEKELNGHAAALLRMMDLREEEGTSGERLRRAVQANGVSLAPYYGLRKDHKEVPAGREEKGPRVRPICAAEDCSTKRVSYLLCKILTPLIPDWCTQCDSTDELLREFEKLNVEQEADEKWVVESLDVDSLYPSLDVLVCSVVVANALMESDIKFENLCWREVALYLRFHMEMESLDCWTSLLGIEDLSRWCPQRRSNLGRPPLFEASGSNNDKDIRYAPWVFPDGIPDDDTVRNMFCVAFGVMVRRTMELHDFCIDGKIYRQKKGGSIGLDLTGVVADIFMCEWDKMLLEKLALSEIIAVVYKRYKDDVNFVLQVDGDEENTAVGHERSKRVMEKVKEIANSIHRSIKVKVDCGYNYENGRLPILDILVWIGKGIDEIWRIMHSHYIKEVSSRMVIGMRSAHGENTKRNVMVNEVCRIMKNCSVYLPWEEVAEKVSYYVRRMSYCGYDDQFRYMVVRMAVSRHTRRIERWRQGKGMFDDRCSEDERREISARKKRDWYKEDGKYESVMFVQPTEGSELKRKIQQIAKKNNVKVKVVEKAGLTVKKVLQKSNPFSKKRCERADCEVCRYGRPGECHTRGCGYQLMCKADRRKYRGQTGRSVYERVKEEVQGWRSQCENNPLWRHSELYHNGQDFDLEVKITDKSFGKPSRRMITESVLIEQLNREETMNSKKKWSYVKLNKVNVG